MPLVGDDLEDVVDVLVDNVFAHTPEGAWIALELAVSPDRDVVVLRVTDGGLGLGSHLPQPEQPGRTGLGLDIARRTAVGAGGGLRVGNAPHGGVQVEVTLPTVPA